MKSCQEFYYEKSLDRLNTFKNSNPNYIFPKKINGVTVTPIPKLLEKINWDMLYEGIPSFIHGDLQFDNVIYGNDTFYAPWWTKIVDQKSVNEVIEFAPVFGKNPRVTLSKFPPGGGKI